MDKFITFGYLLALALLILTVVFESVTAFILSVLIFALVSSVIIAGVEEFEI